MLWQQSSGVHFPITPEFTMPHNVTSASVSSISAGREAWAASLAQAEHHAASYLTAIFPELVVVLRGGPAEQRGLSFHGVGCGSVFVTTYAEQATLHGTGLHWELWSPAVSAAHGGEQFVLIDTEGNDVEEPRAAASGCSYTDVYNQDSLVVQDNGTANLQFLDLSIDEMAQVLAAIRDGLGRLRQLGCTRCHLPQRRHGVPRTGELAVCGSFTLACPSCLPHPDAEDCSRARTGQPCTRRTMPTPAPRPRGGDDVPAQLLEEFSGWDLAALSRSAVELFGTHGDVNDDLSETQKDVLARAAEFFDVTGELE
ncbi:hypothetical protein [Streptomyces californicus]|uniref:hypothetical protein n=1 Tax=Streptomyces californicus TaxID=67351 RepID=UPI00296FEAF5|nr:hypothetical protein [Streptomyces californicus]MDW4912544.1 hypothetical protein [Streptomyces californicus]